MMLIVLERLVRYPNEGGGVRGDDVTWKVVINPSHVSLVNWFAAHQLHGSRMVPDPASWS
jgi:hypothetical protein